MELTQMELTQNQKRAIAAIQMGKSIFVTGPGGSGKSTLIDYIITHLTKKKIGITATTGVAAMLIGGTTLFSYLGIGLGQCDKDQLLTKIKKKSKKVWLNTDLLIIDEISMLSPELFDKLEYISRHLRDPMKPFGGMQLLLSGDFCQLPCINTDMLCFEAKSWDDCIDETIYFDDNLRQGESTFKVILNKLRLGQHTTQDIDELKSLIAKTSQDSITPTKLLCKNVDVDAINDKQLYSLDDEVVYRYDMKVQPFEGVTLSQSFNPAKKCNAPEVLKLSLGAQVMLLYNRDIQAGLVNGSRGVVVDFIETLPVVEFLNGMRLLIGYHIWEIGESDEPLVNIKQIPLRLAYAITVHKSQGMTLDSAHINLKGSQ
jgi:ATP-dependent DNA helicase PIF1